MKICGSNSFPREEDEEEERAIRSAGSSPRRSSHNKNPYSSRGLDKFSALLAEIEAKRQEIYSEINPDEISFVQFDYSKDNNCKPVVVVSDKMKNSRKQLRRRATLERSRSEVGPATRVDEKMNMQKLLRWPKYYLPVVVIVILVLLALFGRSVAIMCTSIGWYIIPTIANGNGQFKRQSFKKKASMAQSVSFNHPIRVSQNVQ